jgi:hypothetical protein
MLKQLLITGATAAVLSAGVVAAPAQAAPSAPLRACHAHKVTGKSYWTCVTPGSYCPANAHGKYGYAAKTGRKYRCLKYSNGRWRWKRA